MGQEIPGAYPLGGVGIHAVHIYDALERTLLRAEEPVDGAVLIHLLVVFPEVLQEVIFQAFAQGLLHEVDIFHQRFLAKGDAQPRLEAEGDMVGQLVVDRHKRDDAVIVDGETADRHKSFVLGFPVALVGKDETRTVDAVTPHHAAYGIADKLFNYHIVIPSNHFCTKCKRFARVITFVIKLTMHVAINEYFSLLQDGDFVQWHIGSQLILQTVDVDKLAVEFLFVGMELHEEGFPLTVVLIYEVAQADVSAAFYRGASCYTADAVLLHGCCSVTALGCAVVLTSVSCASMLVRSSSGCPIKAMSSF